MPLKEIEKILQEAAISNFRREAGWIKAESATASDALRAAKRRASGEPLQYVLGNAPFRDLILDVDPRVLIPRPETESLVDWALHHLPKNGRVLDIGCGSGAIALSIAFERVDADVTAVDLSPDALAVAGHNARKYALDTRVKFMQSDLFSALPGERFDLITANLPYVTEEEYPQLDPEVRDFEPYMALVAPDAGLQLILKVISKLDGHLTTPGAVIFELSPPQAERIHRELESHGFAAETVKDLCGRDRFVCGTKC